ncbi:hypothetical protein M0R45_010418 [Rubus argutus]|uniref:Uncharacterized protein n=1 Tax=Rubus argutus TaxID=59490 RepID=A0AAW1Y7A2_RUBAR
MIIPSQTLNQKSKAYLPGASPLEDVSPVQDSVENPVENPTETTVETPVKKRYPGSWLCLRKKLSEKRKRERDIAVYLAASE